MDLSKRETFALLLALPTAKFVPQKALARFVNLSILQTAPDNAQAAQVTASNAKILAPAIFAKQGTHYEQMELASQEAPAPPMKD